MRRCACLIRSLPASSGWSRACSSSASATHHQFRELVPMMPQSVLQVTATSSFIDIGSATGVEVASIEVSLYDDHDGEGDRARS